jgi:lipopolysaccharide/colanic/teichoic acid biosynthesis glycosyltransferase
MAVTSSSRTRHDDHLARLLQVTKVQEVYQVTPSPYLRRKRWADRVLAAILLVPGLPIIGLLVLLVRLTSRGPGIYRQIRLGLHGRHFKMYKIRTMRTDAESGVGAVWTRRRDPRITRVGRVLRKLHLDEFPQLFNVLRGEMSLVGPRPERPEFVCVLAKQIPGYVSRLAALPGITGLAQINLPPDTDLDSVHRKLNLDLEYIEHARASQDLRMLLCTAVRLTGIPGELAMRLFRLRRHVDRLGAHRPSRNGDGSAISLATPVSILAEKPNAEKPHADSESEGNGRQAAESESAEQVVSRTV